MLLKQPRKDRNENKTVELEVGFITRLMVTQESWGRTRVRESACNVTRLSELREYFGRPLPPPPLQNTHDTVYTQQARHCHLSPVTHIQTDS